jgi:hypothetical protein
MYSIILYPAMVTAGTDYARSHKPVFISNGATDKLQRIGLAAKLGLDA